MPTQIKFLKPTIEIPIQDPVNVSISQLIEISDHCLQEVVFDTKTGKLYSYRNYDLQGLQSHHQELKEILAKLNKVNAYSNTFFVFNTTKIQLIPSDHELSASGSNILDLFFGKEATAETLHTLVRDQPIQLLWRLDRSLHQQLKQHSGSYQIIHAIAHELRPTIHVHSIRCTFYHKQIKLIVHSHQQLIFAGYFNFTTAEDLVYSILNVLDKFSLKAADMVLILNGLIEKESVLYEQLYQFFQNIDLKETDLARLGNDKFHKYPSHYFSQLTELIACVS